MKNIIKLALVICCLSVAAFAQTTTPTSIMTAKTVKAKKVKPVSATATNSSAMMTTSSAKSTATPKTSSTIRTKSAATVARNYQKGSKGGCYYMNGTKKVYVDRNKCQQ